MTGRASKSGIAADIEKKLEQKWDDLEAEGVPQAIVDWINAILDSPDDVCEDANWDTIHRFLKDGTRLVRIANTLLESENYDPIKYSKINSPFFCMDNIGKFLKVAEDYGVKKLDLFQVSSRIELFCKSLMCGKRFRKQAKDLFWQSVMHTGCLP